MEENENVEQEKSDGEETKEKKSFFKWIIIAAIVAVLGAGGYFVWAKFFHADRSKAIALVSEKESKLGPTYSLDTFIVNLAGNKGRRYLKVSMELEMDGDKIGEEIKKRLPQFRDAILVLLSSKSFDQISNIQGKNILRDEIITRLNGFLTSGKIKEVFFTEFVVQ